MIQENKCIKNHTKVHEMYNKKASRRGATKRESQASNSGAEPSEISQQPSCSDQKTEGYRPDALLAIGAKRPRLEKINGAIASTRRHSHNS